MKFLLDSFDKVIELGWNSLPFLTLSKSSNLLPNKSSVEISPIGKQLLNGETMGKTYVEKFLFQIYTRKANENILTRGRKAKIF